MKQVKKQKLLDAGYRFTDTKEFLGLSDGEAASIEASIQLKLARMRQHCPAPTPDAPHP